MSLAKYLVSRGHLSRCQRLVDVRSTRLRIVIIYRPPSSPVHPVSISTFFAEFSDCLESVVMSDEPLVLLGDTC